MKVGLQPHTAGSTLAPHAGYPNGGTADSGRRYSSNYSSLQSSPNRSRRASDNGGMRGSFDFPRGVNGRGLHSSTFQLNLSPFCHTQTDVSRLISQKVLMLSKKGGRV
jgi:hypothetical protein